MDGAEVLCLLHKPGWDTWRELRGCAVKRVDIHAKKSYDSMMKGHTFAPPSNDRGFVYAEALHNLGAAFAKLRRHRHLAGEIGLELRRADYVSAGAALPLSLPTSHDHEAIPLLRQLFDSLFSSVQSYRSTTVWLGKLEPSIGRQAQLFEDIPHRQRCETLDATIDALNQKYGQHTVKPAALLVREDKVWHPRDESPARHQASMRLEGRRRLAIPRLSLDV